jgi:hypothetical protein
MTDSYAPEAIASMRSALQRREAGSTPRPALHCWTEFTLYSRTLLMTTAAAPPAPTLNGQPVDPTTLRGYGTTWTIDANGVVSLLLRGDQVRDITTMPPAGLSSAYWDSDAQGFLPSVIGTPTPPAPPALPVLKALPQGSVAIVNAPDAVHEAGSLTITTIGDMPTTHTLATTDPIAGLPASSALIVHPNNEATLIVPHAAGVPVQSFFKHAEEDLAAFVTRAKEALVALGHKLHL